MQKHEQERGQQINYFYFPRPKNFFLYKIGCQLYQETGMYRVHYSVQYELHGKELSLCHKL